jgi:hypothetical protein
MRSHAGNFLVVFFSWVSTWLSVITLDAIPIILSSVLSIFGIVNYFYQIRKNKRDGDTKK